MIPIKDQQIARIGQNRIGHHTRIVIAGRQIADRTDPRSTDGAVREVRHLRVETVADLRDRAAWIVIIAPPTVGRDSHRLIETIGRTVLHRNGTVAICKDRAAWIASIALPVEIPNAALSMTIAAQADHHAGLTVASLADRAGRTATNALPVATLIAGRSRDLIAGRTDRRVNMAAPVLNGRTQ